MAELKGANVKLLPAAPPASAPVQAKPREEPTSPESHSTSPSGEFVPVIRTR